MFSLPTHQPTHHVVTTKLTFAIISLAALFSVAPANNFNTFYDNPQTSLNNVACTNGRKPDHQRIHYSFSSFPNTGAAEAVGVWNSPLCGSCQVLTYGDNSIYVTTVDTVRVGFGISLEAVNILTNGRAQELDVVNGQATQGDESYCGL